MQERLMTLLRDRETPIEVFRQTTDQLGALLAIQCDRLLKREKRSVETPLKRTQGEGLAEEVVLIPILRAGLSLLFPFLRFYPRSRIGCLGIRRDEQTAVPEMYYWKLPPFNRDRVILLDPMVATGRSAALAVKILKEADVLEEQIILAALIAAPEGLERLHHECPKVEQVVMQVDEGLDAAWRILPGLGDFGDRYFGNDQKFLRS